MARPTNEQLMAMDKDELIILFNAVMDELDELRAKLALQQAEIERLKSPPPNSKNSSMPPSRDMNKRKRKEAKEIKKRGAREGHVMKKRELLDNPDTVIVGALEKCCSGPS